MRVSGRVIAPEDYCPLVQESSAVKRKVCVRYFNPDLIIKSGRVLCVYGRFMEKLIIHGNQRYLDQLVCCSNFSLCTWMIDIKKRRHSLSEFIKGLK